MKTPSASTRPGPFLARGGASFFGRSGVLAIALALVTVACPPFSRDGEAGPVSSDSLIPLERLLGPARMAAPRMSPDGAWVSFIAPLEDAANLWIAPAERPSEARPLTREPGRGIQAADASGRVTYRWTADSRHVTYFMDRNGDENWQLHVVSVEGGSRALTAIPAAQVRLYGLGERDPDVALIGINLRDPRRHDLYRLSLATGDTTMVERNQRFVSFVVDREPRVRLAVEVAQDASLHLLRAGAAGKWEPWDVIPPGESFGRVLSFDPENRRMYATSAKDRNTLAVVERDLETGATRLIAGDERSDISDVLVHPVTGRPQAYASHWTRRQWQVLEKEISGDLSVLEQAHAGELAIESRSREDRRWIVSYAFDSAPTRFFVYEPPTRRLIPLGVSHPDLEGLPLARTRPVVTRSRDGWELVSYLTLPRAADPDEDGVPSRPLPMVLLVHGGPGDERAEWRFAPYVQWLANRGYAVLNANYRGSPGFGKAFQDAERLEWGGRMHDDLVDQVRWAIRGGIADSARVAILGGSYGGYATLVGMTMTPEVFACGVDVVGPANLETFMARIPPHWSLDHFARRVGDPRTEEGRAHLRSRSPITHVGRARNPILIAQGAHDPRVPQAESDSMVAALVARGVPVTYLLFPDEGHGFVRAENRRAFDAITEAFLARWIGGRSASLDGALAGSSVDVREGAHHVPGLREALAAVPRPGASRR